MAASRLLVSGFMNICLVSREFPPDTDFGGMSTFSVDTARMLRARGHKVTVFSQSLGSGYVADFEGICVYKIQVPAPFASYRVLPMFTIAFNFLVYRAVMALHKVQPFDVIDVPDHLAEGLFLTLFSPIPVVTRLHTPFALLGAMGLNNYKKDLTYYLIYLFERLALKNSDLLYAPCTDLVRRCENLFGLDLQSKVEIFGYLVDLKKFFVKGKGSDSTSRILFLGRLEQRKGVETIAQAFPMLHAECPHVTLTMVGRDTPNIKGYDSCRSFLKDRFVSHGCFEAVSFIDHLPLDMLPDVIRVHDIVWVPSEYDNFPIVCLEAMACGKVVVVSNAGGLPEMVSDGDDGMVFPVGDADALARVTLALLKSPERIREIGVNARAYVEDSCSESTIYQKTVALYDKAIRRFETRR